MNARRWSIALAVAVTAAVLAGVATFALDGDGGTGSSGYGAVSPPNPSGAARTEFPGLAAPRGEPQLPGIRSAHPRPRTVVAVAGPFDDRFDLTGLAVREGTVTGRVTITSDVSDLLELQVLAGFYDADGTFLGTGRFVHHLTEEKEHTGPPSERQRFSVVAPAGYRDKVRSAAIGVPVLVNE